MSDAPGGSEHVVPVNIDVTESKVTFTTKELLARIDLRFEHLESLAEGATTRAEFSALSAKVDKLERDSEGTKAVAIALLGSDKDRWTKNEKIAGLMFTLVALAPSVLALAKALGWS